MNLRQIRQLFNARILQRTFSLGLFCASFSLISFGQINISIGNPVDALEGSSDITFDIFIEGGGVNTTGSAITGTINYSGAGMSGVDFSGPPNFSIPIGANSTTLIVTVIDDAIIEPTETVTATLVGAPRAGSYANAASTASILDDDSGSIYISIGSPVDGIEGSSDVSFTVFLEGGVVNSTGSDITGSFMYAGSATISSDYLPVATFSIPVGANSTVVVLPVLDESVSEGCETIVAIITNPNIGTINTATSTATIFDDDFVSTLSIGSPVDGSEPGSNVSFVVSIDNGAGNCTGSPITGSISYGGSAIDGTDYSGVYSFSIPVGSNSVTITIPVINDALPEPTESIIAILTGSPSIGSYATTTASASIFDDDSGSIVLSIGSPVDGTEGSTFISYVVSIDGGVVNNTGSPITGSMTYTGTATNGADYAGVASFSIPDGAGSTLIILVVNDDIFVECDETVIATISNPSIGTINSSANSATANIIDDECAQGGISIGSPMDGEEGGVDMSFVISLDNGAINTTGSPISGSINYSGSASMNDVSILPTSFSIPDGASATTLIIPVVDDNLLECDETVMAVISNPSSGVIGNGSSTAIIVDNECSQATISIVSPTDGAENGSDITFIVTLDNGVINATGAPIVANVGFSGTATPSIDYQDFNTVSIADGFGYSTHPVVINDDILAEPTESVIVTISNPTFASVGIAVDTAYILDDDSTSGIEALNAFDLRIFPNPVSANLNITADQQMSDYSIIDLNGRVINSEIVEAKEFTVATDFLSSGSYFVEVRFENGTSVTKKIVKD